jgi:prolipoprotein diacylglyceryltransferase
MTPPTLTFWEGGVEVIGILIAVLLAALVYALCVALNLPAIVGIVAAILVLLAGIPTGGYGLGGRFGGRGRV